MRHADSMSKYMDLQYLIVQFSIFHTFSNKQTCTKLFAIVEMTFYDIIWMNMSVICSSFC